jgi:hypothetical protein
MLPRYINFILINTYAVPNANIYSVLLMPTFQQAENSTTYSNKIFNTECPIYCFYGKCTCKIILILKAQPLDTSIEAKLHAFLTDTSQFTFITFSDLDPSQHRHLCTCRNQE